MIHNGSFRDGDLLGCFRFPFSGHAWVHIVTYHKIRTGILAAKWAVTVDAFPVL